MSLTPEEYAQQKQKYEKMAQNTKRHHWVPQFYLQRFATSPESKQVYMYRRSEEPILVNISNIAAAHEWNTLTEDQDGKTTRAMEGVFSEHEGSLAPIISQIIKDEKLPTTVEEVSHLAEFVALLHVRGPSFAEWQKNMDVERMKFMNTAYAQHPEALKEAFERSGVAFESNEEFEKTRKFMSDPANYSIEVENGKEHYFKEAMSLGRTIYDILTTQKSWHILAAPEGRHFITSDNPVVIQTVEGCPPHLAEGFLNGTVLLPISPKLCLAFRSIPLKAEKVFLSKKDVESINRSIASAARKQVYGHIKSKDFQKISGDHLAGDESRVSIRRIVRFAPYYESKGLDRHQEANGIKDNSTDAGSGETS